MNHMERKYIIVEDEPLARELMKDMVGRLRPEWRLDFTASSKSEVEEYFAGGGAPDLCFMDIELADGNIFDLFKRMRIDTPVIFTTAYDSYCLDAFKANSVSYVLKPIDEDELREAIEKFERTHGTAPSQSAAMSDLEALVRKMTAPKPEEKSRRVLTSVGDRYGYVDVDEAAWFVSEDKYVYAVTKDGRKELTVLRYLTDVEEMVSERDFFRLSRKVICSIRAIDNITRHFKGRLKVRLRAGDAAMEETVSADRRIDFLAWIGSGAV